MNVADSLRVSAALEKMGYEAVKQPDNADVIVLNTCVVRQSAEDKAIGRLSSLKPLKTANPDLVINLMGCLIGVKENATLKKRFPWVDVFSPPSDPAPLIKFLQERESNRSQIEQKNFLDNLLDEGFAIPKTSNTSMVSAFIPVVLGCSHACTYCIIPSRRGREISRPFNQIIQEAHQLVDQGVKEITLLGQIVDRYGLDLDEGKTLASILAELQKIEGLLRIRFLTSHPNWMTDELINAVNDLPKVMPHIEVPIQAGDDKVLAAMRRNYTVEDYRRLIEKIRNKMPAVSIGTDIIVGFPGETHDQFMQTHQLLAELKLDVAHLARYSPRTGTYSARFLADDVPQQEKMQRFRMLEDLQKGIITEINSHYSGKSVPVLFETKSKNRWCGRTPTNRLVFVEHEDDLIGSERQVNINWAGPWSLIGEI